jgi:glyoxylase-like metal-dependent hydrolase (beta-lactamase superfamily II)
MLTKIVTPPLAANSYLLKVEKVSLIDVGGDARFLIKALRRYVNPKDVEYIFLTHSHFDHAAAASDLKLFGCKIVMHEREYEFLKGFTSTFFSKLEPDVLVKDGEVFDLGIKLEVIHTPGHTPGSVCFYERGKKWLFSGDTVFSDGYFGRVDLPGGNARELIQSIEKLSKLDVENLYPGHEEEVEGDAIEHIKKSLNLARMVL